MKAASKRILCQKSILYTLMKPRVVHGWNKHNRKNHKQLMVNCVTHSCLGIHQSSTVQTYHIYRVTDYIRLMFTTKSLRGNLLIQMQLILANKVHIYLWIHMQYPFPINVGDWWVCCKNLWEIEEKRGTWKVENLNSRELEKSSYALMKRHLSLIGGGKKNRRA